MNFLKNLYRSGKLPRWLIFLSIIMFIVVYLSFRETTQAKFYNGCLQGDSRPTPAQCQCLTDYVFEHLDGIQVIAIMEPKRIRKQDDMERIQQVLRAGTEACGW
ncbi:hypothetical protein LGV61_11355 [Desulfurispirillum indicum]|uniref:Uncharacterized protein n=1 Tax=Desulfurispirillum indicum (strain ATCC BAA-1389 / DSM 22839 / S5) TaxID=653733 RepID=E6W416_DESIS|nr:hypothetical protein [Desulfurispirillum indicum]ADU66980.1 hypothetical protein Selin_2260 [Desulfurispirillum indicum S5]UCZ56313.1 hypothetical protein LGV61_11355 [Desulfurispirillum indicum]